ncbi:MAG: flagellar biosynthesis protein FlhF [Pirellulales bacterium]|nr:flagellar biosynthesis protein FlhF [Pirellulales bacterium]
MDVRTFRATTMYEALALVRRELGPEAAVLHTREIRRRRWFGLAPGRSEIEVIASAEVNVPSRLPARPSIAAEALAGTTRRVAAPARPAPTPIAPPQPRPRVSTHVQGQITNLQGMVADLCRHSRTGKQRDLPDSLFRLFTDLIEADVNEKLARELVEKVHEETPDGELADPVMVKARLARILESEIAVAGPIGVTPGRHRVVALVGPTGVGKTTTIAKLAANYRLKMRQNVGLITVDTYRIAAVEQLRTYADIIDLPMQVVSTPREMREAVHRLSGLDLILMDTAGRSPRDEIKIQELRAFLSEAGADEVHLVLSGVAGERTLEQTAKRFAAVGTTAVILTKLDEASALGNLLPLLRSRMLPLSYLTNGQNVPDDIETADAARIVQVILSGPSASNGW